MRTQQGFLARSRFRDANGQRRIAALAHSTIDAGGPKPPPMHRYSGKGNGRNIWTPAFPYLVGAFLSVMVGKGAVRWYDECSQKRGEQGRYRLQVERTTSSLEKILQHEANERLAFLQGDVETSNTCLEWACNELEILRTSHMPICRDVPREEEQVLVDAYNAFAEKWAEDRGCTPFLASTVRDVNMQLSLLQCHLTNRKAACAPTLDTSRQTLLTVVRSSPRLSNDWQQAWMEHLRSSGLSLTSMDGDGSEKAGENDFFCSGASREKLQQYLCDLQHDLVYLQTEGRAVERDYDHGSRSAVDLVERLRKCVKVADRLTAPFQTYDAETLTSVSESIAAFMNTMRSPDGYSEYEWILATSLRKDLHEVRLVGEACLLDAWVLPKKRSRTTIKGALGCHVTPQQMRDQLTRSASTWREAIRARCTALWFIATSFHFGKDGTHTVADVTEFLQGLTDTLPPAEGHAQSTWKAKPHKLFHQAYTTLDGAWLHKEGAGQVLTAMAAGLEVLLRHNRIEPSVADAARREAVRCLAARQSIMNTSAQTDLHSSERIRYTNSQASLIQFLLENRDADVKRTVQSMCKKSFWWASSGHRCFKLWLYPSGEDDNIIVRAFRRTEQIKGPALTKEESMAILSGVRRTRRELLRVNAIYNSATRA